MPVYLRLLAAAVVLSWLGSYLVIWALAEFFPIGIPGGLVQ